MSNSREIMNLGTMPYYVPFYECPCTTFVIDVGRVVLEPKPSGPRISLAPNHQDYTPSHRKNRRGKFKRSGR